MKIKALLYCTKAKKQKDLLWSNNLKRFFLDGAYNRVIDDLPTYLLNGKIVAECDFEVEEIDTMALSEHVYDDYYNNNIDRISKESCLTCEQMSEYLGSTWDSKGYAIHIKNLHIFDEPKNLLEYLGAICKDSVFYPLQLSPRNMMYAYQRKDKQLIKFKNWQNFDWALLDKTEIEDVDKYVLIPIQPDYLCKILNGEKKVEIRKKVLKEMIDNG